jgi:nitrous oxidase accessory protein NosD
MLTDKQCEKLWNDPKAKINISTPEGAQVMKWVEKQNAKLSNKPVFDIKSGIN